jgi:hypothetical protein
LDLYLKSMNAKVKIQGCPLVGHQKLSASHDKANEIKCTWILKPECKGTWIKWWASLQTEVCVLTVLHVTPFFILLTIDTNLKLRL